MKTDKNLIKLKHDFYCLKSKTIYCGLNPCTLKTDIRTCRQCEFYRALYLIN